MNAQNAKLWTVVAGVVAACPSLFCCTMGFATLFGGGTYEMGGTMGQTPAWVGLPLICLGLLPWALPAIVWRYASTRPAPPEAGSGMEQ